MYPAEILPQKNFIKIDSKILCQNCNAFLLRRSCLREPLGSDGKVKFDALIEAGKESFFYDLSWNLLGIFKREHAKYVVQVKDSNSWDTGMDIPLVEEIKFVETEMPVIFLSCKLIYNFPYLYRNQEQKEKDPTEKKGILFVEHKPFDINFWHFQFFVVKENGEVIRNASSKEWTKESLMRNSQIKILLINNMSLDEPKIYDKCPMELYVRK